MTYRRNTTALNGAIILAIATACTLGGGQAVPPPIENAVVMDDASIRERDAGHAPPLDDADVSSDGDGGGGLTGDAGTRDAATDDPNHCAGADASCEAPASCTRADHAGHAYFFCSDSLTWSEARARCRMAGTDLVVIDDADENAFVAGNLAATSWIGANDITTEGTWGWIVPGDDAVTGPALGYTSWFDTTKPDNCGLIFGDQDCGRIASDGTWDDSSCDGGCTEGTFTFVCESY